ncbi:hypothetical protein [Agathobaculum sp.]|uniref:hypothetical protein n=1 Tax=Agathobaculum sp. TaxID=2048138 RepID=UPI002A84166B|nr:hypothetical protein [Agathobaculum sp.]MDY3618725.1 hypothetical protein [Agathobaculum sp.]
MNENYTIDAFAEPITALSTQPSLPPDELKRRLQAPAEEVRQAHNALCGKAKQLESRINNYQAATFNGEITRDMLEISVQNELSSKAGQDGLDALSIALDTACIQLAKKCEICCGTYRGDDAQTRTISLGFRPLAVYIAKNGTESSDLSRNTVYGGLALDGHPAYFYGNVVEIVDSGFLLTHANRNLPNLNNETYYYIVLKQA